MPTILRRLFDLPSKLLRLPFNSFGAVFAPKLPTFPCAMDVSNATFPQELIKIIQNVADSRFIAFDLEFSGVAPKQLGGRSEKFTLQELYQDLRSAAQIYQILQVGLTIVTEDVENARYIARPYNFNLCPLPAIKESAFQRVWSYNSGAISFLMRNGFSIDRPLLQGVHYLSRQEQDQIRKNLIEAQQARANIPDMILKEEDSVLVDHIKQSIKQWQELPKDQQETYINIPAEDANDPIPSALNRYQVRLIHQIVRNEYPSLRTQGMGHFVQITSPTVEQQANQKEIQEQMLEREVGKAVGFRWIVEAIIGGDISTMPHYYVRAGFPEGKAPKDIQNFLDQLQTRLRSQTRALVGHNCMTDVMNLYRCFFGDLPDRLEDFRTRLHELFPIILDTKYIAGLESKGRNDTSLRQVEIDLYSEGMPKIHLPINFDRYLYAPNYHEAGFDSFVTAKIGLKLSAKLKRERIDVKLLGGPASPSPTGNSTSVAEEGEQEATAATASLEKGQQQGFTDSLVEAIKAPVTVVKSILTSPESRVQDKANIESGSGPKSVNVIPEETTSLAPPTTKKGRRGFQGRITEPEDLKSMSQKSNIFDMLEDDPPEPGKKEIGERERIAELVREGQLIPRWEEDAEFWKLISNKLQVNASQEGILDLM
ncbi:uncharacterized protein Z518_05409 [Rhinocladiella mackenziei CBS 650.93]|uniref:Rhinocladiella mackenziei CBS 650.93 unplaced genomic scaffold supercont1.4, whole genome shotgun sequence n=1 Tax=Rhinocladiella mackenziei CBS 650.93 TaxID=1442369 RepID=A0A0D2IFG2_9EURO|nr:uncharacterized protein Z518_05409 [Rhinocladiella mackenziei CBS 650.93]KIX04539.1 hypothetical protein Z518_05409 [Rhinocladiella mackenziei CBS 650.93]